MAVRSAIYRPTHLRQKLRLDGALIGCTDTCLAMLVDAVTLGGVKVTERAVRKLSDEPVPDPNSPGLNLPQLTKVARKLHVVLLDKTGESPHELRGYLDEDRRAIVQLWYAGIGGTSIGHAVLVQTRRERNGNMDWLVNDPMKTRPEWIDGNRVTDAMHEFARRTSLPSPALRFAVSRVVPRIAKETR